MAVEFAPSLSPKTVCIPIIVIDDDAIEGEETFRLELSTLQEQVLLEEPSSAAVTVVDGDGKSQRSEYAHKLSGYCHQLESVKFEIHKMYRNSPIQLTMTITACTVCRLLSM